MSGRIDRFSDEVTASVWAEPVGVSGPEYGPYADEIDASEAMDVLGLTDATHRLVWREGRGAPVVTEMRHGITISRETLEQWAGRTLSDGEVARLDACLHASSVPDAVGAIAEGLRNGAPTA